MARADGSVTLAFLDRHRRRIRLTTDGGASFLLDLPRAVQLAEGDGLELAGGGIIAVKAAAEDLLEITSHDAAALARLAWHLGNRHLPMQIGADSLIIRADHVIADMLRGLGAVVTPIRAPFDPEGGAYETGKDRHAHVDHGHHDHAHHDHAHPHDH